MTRKEYEEYKETVAEFFSHGLNNLSIKSNENGGYEPFFSWSKCQCCKDSLGGTRYECNGFNEKTQEIEEYNCICENCTYYCSYGQLDDTTMSEIEEKTKD